MYFIRKHQQKQPHCSTYYYFQYNLLNRLHLKREREILALEFTVHYSLYKHLISNAANILCWAFARIALPSKDIEWMCSESDDGYLLILCFDAY